MRIYNRDKNRVKINKIWADKKIYYHLIFNNTVKLYYRKAYSKSKCKIKTTLEFSKVSHISITPYYEISIEYQYKNFANI